MNHTVGIEGSLVAHTVTCAVEGAAEIAVVILFAPLNLIGG